MRSILKIRACDICMFLIILSVVNMLSAQVISTGLNETADNIFVKTADSSRIIKLETPDDSLAQRVQLRSCVSTFSGQTVSSIMSVVGCNTLSVQNITVTGSGNLSLNAPVAVAISSDFYVPLGGVLKICGEMPGNTMQSPITIGTYNTDFLYSDIQNTVDFTNEYAGRPANDVFYEFTITTPMNITVKHCDSSIDTYVHLLNNSGTSIASNDDYNGIGACSNTLHAYLKLYLEAGTYYVVSEGYSANGIIKTTVIGEIPIYNFNYTYDASGNRINRTVIP